MVNIGRYLFHVAVIQMAMIPGFAYADWSPRPSHYIETYPDYHFIAETSLMSPNGQPYSLCIAYAKTNIGTGHGIIGYALSPNGCKPRTSLFGLFQSADPEVVILTKSDVVELKASRALPPDLPDDPQLPTKEKIRAAFAIYIFAAIIGLLVIGVLISSWIDVRRKAAHRRIRGKE